MYSSAALPSFYIYWILLSTIIFYQLLAPCVASFCNFRFLPFFLLWASSFFCFPNENIAPLDILKIPLKDAVIKKINSLLFTRIIQNFKDESDLRNYESYLSSDEKKKPEKRHNFI